MKPTERKSYAHDEVLALMKSSKSEKEWQDNCTKVKKAHSGQYPEYWYDEIVVSGLASRMAKSFGDADIRVVDVNLPRT